MLRTLLEVAAIALIVAGVGVAFGLAAALVAAGAALLVVSWRMGAA